MSLTDQATALWPYSHKVSPSGKVESLSWSDIFQRKEFGRWLKDEDKESLEVFLEGFLLNMNLADPLEAPLAARIFADRIAHRVFKERKNMAFSKFSGPGFTSYLY
jgi:hypothetical protein